jgi:plastocyanin
VSRRFALVGALGAALLMPGIAAASTTFTVTVSNGIHAFSNASPKLALGDSVQWQAITTNTAHTSTSDRFGGTAFGWSFSLPQGSETTSAQVFNSAGGFAFHCMIHPGMRGTVLVQMQADDMTPVVGQTITITFALSAPPPGFSETIQKRKLGGTWANFSIGNYGTTVTWKPLKAKTYQFQAQLVQGSIKSLFSPILQLTVTAH